ncbi:MAG: spore coat associated protein CotJA [Clostridiales bacterium]|jgi:hypothetical protein|nr:spore coat associated protein CotJA [Clostridiales bacterium]
MYKKNSGSGAGGLNGADFWDKTQLPFHVGRGCRCDGTNAPGEIAGTECAEADEVELAQAVVPFQTLSQGCLFSAEEALQNGTIFSALYKPYKREKCHCAR